MITVFEYRYNDIEYDILCVIAVGIIWIVGEMRFIVMWEVMFTGMFGVVNGVYQKLQYV